MSMSIGGHFTYPRLLRFVISPILMMICTSIYSVIDGFFISNFIGKVPFAAVNLIMPVDMLAVALGFMMGEGGNAIISKTLGEGKKELANRYFSLLVCVSLVLGLILSVGCTTLVPEIARALGANEQLMNDCIAYGRILFAGHVFYLLQNVFQSFYIAAGRPDLSLKTAITAGVVNAVLDYVFIVVLQLGLAGAAAATVLGQATGALIPLIYFTRQNSSLLQLSTPKWYPSVVLKTFSNGSSEMVSVLSASVVSVLYNYQLLSIAGEDGVAAYGAIMYVDFIFMAVLLGYASGSAPLISFQYGAKNKQELHNLFRKSLIIMSITGLIMTGCSQLLAEPLLKMFVGYDQGLFDLTLHGFRIFSLSFLIMGFNIFGSGFFTALNNGLISAIVSFMRTMCFEVICVLVLPIWLGINGIWSSIVVAEFLAASLTAYYLLTRRQKYGY